MADAKKVKIGGIWYNVKDETARNALAAKQDKLTFDTAPTASSTNPVTSGGVKTALDNKYFLSANNGLRIRTIANDTVANWIALKNSVFFYGLNDELTDKPSNYGILINTLVESEVSQIWFTQSSGKIYRRSGNMNSGWATSWVEIFSESSVIPTANGGTGGTDSGWQTMQTLNCSTGYIYYRKIGYLCEVRGYDIQLSSNLNRGDVIIIGYMPSGYCPTMKNAFCTACAGVSNPIFADIRITGEIRFYAPSYKDSISTSDLCYFSANYICV